jgi:RHH-type transcriptional regulator, rel operon repressor / antitoxin RelB
MITIELPGNLEQRLQSLADATGRSRSDLALEALMLYVDDLEGYVAEARARMGRPGVPWAELARQFGLSR